MQLSLDTKSKLGVFTSKREVIIEDPLYDELCAACIKASQTGDKAKIAKARAELMNKWFKQTIQPGQVCKLNQTRQVNTGQYQGAKSLSADIQWRPTKDYLRIVADITDASFSTDVPENQPWEASSLEILISPGGVDDAINHFFVVPKGDGRPRIDGVHTDEEFRIIAFWKRTDKGYKVDMKIPYSILRGYEQGWSVMPVEAMINSKTPKGRVQLVMNQPGEPWKYARNYAGLKAQ